VASGFLDRIWGGRCQRVSCGNLNRPSLQPVKQPTVNGAYLIKVLSQDLFIEKVAGDKPKLKLAAPSHSDSQKVSIYNIITRDLYLSLQSIECTDELISGTSLKFLAEPTSGR
jgi:hypothetical protein